MVIPLAFSLYNQDVRSNFHFGEEKGITVNMISNFQTLAYNRIIESKKLACRSMQLGERVISKSSSLKRKNFE